jgi:hypothetical protein
MDPAKAVHIELDLSSLSRFEYNLGNVPNRAMEVKTRSKALVNAAPFGRVGLTLCLTATIPNKDQ